MTAVATGTAARPSSSVPAVKRPPGRPGPLRLLALVWDKTLNSVVFVIVTMLTLAAYVAIGSGLPEVRAYFEMTEMQFFNAWPMPVMAALLVVNLLTVSLNRIPFTLPRMGVWTIHLGIVVLIFGMTAYFTQKTEGMSLIRMGEEVRHFYDAHERSLYVSAGKRKLEPISLPKLPKFEPHTSETEPDYFADRGMTGLVPQAFAYDEEARRGTLLPMHESPAIPLEGDEPVEIDVLAFEPYAVIGASYAIGQGELTGIRMTVRDPVTGGEVSRWAVSEQAGHPRDDVAEEQVAAIRVKHVHRTDKLTGPALASAAQRAHEITWHVGTGHEGGQTITLEPGERKPLGDTGYELEAVAFLPGFPMFGDGEPVDAFELLVHPPADSPHGKTFRRYLLDGRHVETDFVLGVEGAGPKGQRQTQPVDTELHLHYALADGLDLLPKPGEDERHTLLTKHDRPGFWRVITRADQPTQIEDVPSGKLELLVNGLRRDPETGATTPVSLELDVERFDAVTRSDFVRPVPPERREEDAGRAGTFNVATIAVRRGDWSEVVHVPFSQWPDQMAWQPAAVNVPGLRDPLRFQLGNTRREMPARVRLDEFELVPYAGDFTSDSPMRDFRSILTVEPRGGGPTDAVVRLNKPHYMDVPRLGPLASVLPSESWLLFQSQWDPEDQAFTVLGVGNRPGVVTMTVGCVMIVAGLLFAFYVKPIIIRRRKAAALAAHHAGAGPRSQN